MIQIIKGDVPPCLAAEGPALVAEHYAVYNAIVNKTDLTRAEKDAFKPYPLYRSEEVKDALVIAQAGEKCAYCEKHLAEEAKHVDHFRPFKAVAIVGGKLHPGYFWLGYTWDNLYLTCHGCNSSYKKDNFPLINPNARARPGSVDLTPENRLLIDPGNEDPRDYIRFRRDAPYAFGESEKGETTIEVLKLRKRVGLRVARDRWFGYLENLRKVVEIFRDNPTYIHLKDVADNSIAVLRSSVERPAPFSSMAIDYLDDLLRELEAA